MSASIVAEIAQRFHIDLSVMTKAEVARLIAACHERLGEYPIAHLTVEDVTEHLMQRGTAVPEAGIADACQRVALQWESDECEAAIEEAVEWIIENGSDPDDGEAA